MTSATAQPRPYIAYALTLLACACIYLPRLGATGLSSTEGHRVIPAWEMLASRDFLVPRLFGQAYLRKPPGMPWAIALSSSLFGQTEFAARLVSGLAVTVLCLLCAHTAHRWFGPSRPCATGGLSGAAAPASALQPSPALLAGLSAALLPLFWTIGRTAEIEALNTLAAAGAVVCLLDLLLPSPAVLGGGGGRGAAEAGGGHVLRFIAASAAITLALFAKGPAALPTVAAAIAAACLTTRSLKPLARPALWLALAIPAALFALYAFRVRAALELSHETPILQGPSDFLWSADTLSLSRIGKVAAMPFAALFAALPAALFLIPSKRAQQAPPHAAALALTCLLSLGALTVLGVSNPRYALPALGFLPILAAYATLVRPRFFAPRTLAIAVAVLAAGAAFYVLSFEPRSRATSGREPGETLALSLPQGAEVWADGLIEARPEVLLYAARAKSRDLRIVNPEECLRVRWVPGLAQSGKLPPPGTYVVLRTDQMGDETATPREKGLTTRLNVVASGAVHKYTYTLYQVPP
jgi:4-amino-4-deoxy-L-arabinose transferase-like glycosyltransferase